MMNRQHVGTAGISITGFLLQMSAQRKVVATAFMALLTYMGAVPAHAAMRGYIVTSFDGIRVQAPVRIVLSTGSGVSAMGEGDRDVLNRVNLSVSGGVLTVTMEDESQSGFNSQTAKAPPVLMLATGQLRNATVMGGGVLTISELSGMEVSISMNGNGEIDVARADVENLSLFIGGGGRVRLSGSAHMVEASVTGAGELQAEGMVARNAIVANDGPGGIYMQVNGSVQIRSSGSGNVKITGKPVCTINQQGAGQVDCAK